MAWIRDSTSARLSGERFAGFGGCCVWGAAGRESALSRFAGASDAAETMAARRANSRRDIAWSFSLPIIKAPLRSRIGCKAQSEATESAWQRQLPHGIVSLAHDMSG